MSSDPENDAPVTRGRGGFFSKVKRGLFMTHTEVLEKLGSAVKKGLGIDESVLESLEEALVSADVGAETADALTEAVRSRAGGSCSVRWCRTIASGARAPTSAPRSRYPVM